MAGNNKFFITSLAVLAIPIIGWNIDYFWTSLLVLWLLGLWFVEVVPRNPNDYGGTAWVWAKLLWPLLYLFLTGCVLFGVGGVRLSKPTKAVKPTPPQGQEKKLHYRSIDD